MWDKIISILGIIFDPIISAIHKSREPSEQQKEYEQLRKEISAALVFYANCYSNPVDLAKTNNKLPQRYEEASTKYRELSSKLRAFLETLPEKDKQPKKALQKSRKVKQSKKEKIPPTEQLDAAAKGLMGLSNSIKIPINCSTSSEDMRNTRDFVKMVKDNLNLSSGG